MAETRKDTYSTMHELEQVEDEQNRNHCHIRNPLDYEGTRTPLRTSTRTQTELKERYIHSPSIFKKHSENIRRTVVVAVQKECQ